ncbi:MAG: hypothetical protein N2572_08550 [Syntrophales bacterium]|nr:hypothetical protein [Syntrophales bacterium]
MCVSKKISFHRFIPHLDSTLDYIRMRRCQSGGYCFYRLEEPNCSDTYFALATLHLMDRLSFDKETADFLLSRQRPDGSYESLSQAFFSIGGLRLLKLKPLYDPREYLFAHTQAYDVSLLPPGTNSIFAPLYFLVNTLKWLNIKVPKKSRHQITSFVLYHRKESGGFGHIKATLMETRDAMVILDGLGVTCPWNITDFLSACEDINHGFVNIKGIRFSYLEHIQAGLEICHWLSFSPTYPGSIFNFLQACYRVNGGYARTTNTGIASLEDTYLAISSFQLLLPFLS